MNNPERDPWPSTADPGESDACVFCEAMPHEKHQPSCPLADSFDFGDVQFCDGCNCSYVTECGCDEGDD